MAATDDEIINEHWPELAALDRTLERINGTVVGVGGNAPSSDPDMRDLLRTARARKSA